MKRLFIFLSIILLAAGSVIAQITVKGRVVDNNNEVLPGATIVVKGTQQGFITDQDGNFTITNASKGDVLVVSFIGMVTQEIKIGSQTQINITLSPDVAQLDEVVIVDMAM